MLAEPLRLWVSGRAEEGLGPRGDQGVGKSCTWVQFHREGRPIGGDGDPGGNEKLVRASAAQWGQLGWGGVRS